MVKFQIADWPGSIHANLKFPCEKRRLWSVVNLFTKKVLLRPFPDALFIYVARAVFPNYKSVLTVNLRVRSIKNQMIRGFGEYLSNSNDGQTTFCVIGKGTAQMIKLDGQVFRFGFEGWDGFSMGNAYLRIEEGKLTQSDRAWSFDGRIRMLDEIFDFNPGIDPRTGLKYRTGLKEFLVKIGRLFPGKPFSVHYLDESGNDNPLDVHLEGITRCKLKGLSTNMRPEAGFKTLEQK